MEKYTKEQIKEFISEPLFDEKAILKKDYSCPKISVVTTSFNQEHFLERTILSVLNQNYPNLEFIITDGGSTDGSLDIIKKYEKYLAFWVSEKDKGQSDGLNKGFKKAAGDIVGWQNSDDIYLPGTFGKIVELFGNNSSAEVIYGNRLDIDENDEVMGRSIFTRFSRIGFQYEGILLGTQSTFWKRDLFNKIGYLDLNYKFAMDYDFFLRAASKKVKFKYAPYYFGAMRRHNESKTEKFLGTPPHQEECLKIAQRYGRIKWFNLPLKIYSLSFRIVSYFLQGDIDYVLAGFKRRIKRKTFLSGR